jgi:hypothetical protein
MRKKSVVSDYILWVSVLLIGIAAVTFVYNIYLKSKTKAEEVKQPQAVSLGGNIEVVKTNEGYKILVKKEFKLSNVGTFYFKVKDDNGDTICTCYYQKTGSLVCDNCSVEQ